MPSARPTTAVLTEVRLRVWGKGKRLFLGASSLEWSWAESWYAVGSADNRRPDGGETQSVGKREEALFGSLFPRVELGDTDL